MTPFVPRTAAAFLLPLVIGACTQNPVVPDSPTAEQAATAPREAASPATAESRPVAAGQVQAGADPASRAAAGLGDAGGAQRPLESIGAPEQRSVYFDFDRYDIRTEFKDLVVGHGKFLGSRPDAKMLIQGNADERGSREYNLALGQKRADAVKKALMLQGVREEAIEAVSLGEEKPKAPGHDEASWAENRRADILYRGEY